MVEVDSFDVDTETVVLDVGRSAVVDPALNPTGTLLLATLGAPPEAQAGVAVPGENLTKVAPVSTAAWFGDGTVLAATTGGFVIRLVDLEGTLIREFPIPDGFAFSEAMAASPVPDPDWFIVELGDYTPGEFLGASSVWLVDLAGEWTRLDTPSDQGFGLVPIAEDTVFVRSGGESRWIVEIGTDLDVKDVSDPSYMRSWMSAGGCYLAYYEWDLGVPSSFYIEDRCQGVRWVAQHAPRELSWVTLSPDGRYFVGTHADEGEVVIVPFEDIAGDPSTAVLDVDHPERLWPRAD